LWPKLNLIVAIDTRLSTTGLKADLILPAAGYYEKRGIKYAVALAATTRDPVAHGLPDLAKFLSFGVSPRGPIHLVEGARALAQLRGRSYVLPQDVVDLVPDVFRHRLVLTYEALAEGMTADELIHRFLRKVPAPEKPLETHVKVTAQA